MKTISKQSGADRKHKIRHWDAMKHVTISYLAALLAACLAFTPVAQAAVTTAFAGSTPDITRTYDYADQPRAVSGAASGTYHYDGNLKRVKSVVNGRTTYNVYDAAGQLVHVDQRPGGGQSERRTDYITVSGMTVARVEAGIAYRFYHTDHLGSSAVGTASNGSVLWEEYNTPFGEVMSSTPYNDDQAAFTGHIRDSATGLNYMQARYYDPVIGRFLSIDPVTFDGTNHTGFFNRYAYTFNNPVNMIDPDGKLTITRSFGISFPRPKFLRLEGDDVSAVGFEIGIALSFPIPFIDPDADFDAGGFVTAKGGGAVGTGGTGKVVVSSGVFRGSVPDLAGEGREFSVQVPVTPIPGTPIANPLGPSVGVGVEFGDNGFKPDGFTVARGIGTDVSGYKTITKVCSVRFCPRGDEKNESGGTSMSNFISGGSPFEELPQGSSFPRNTPIRNP